MPDDTWQPNEPIFAPGLRPETPAGRVRKAIGISLSMAWLLWPILDLAGAGEPAWRMVLAYGSLVAWLGIYFGFVLATKEDVGQRQTLIWLVTLLAVAIALTGLDRPSWSVLIIYCASAGGISLRNPRTGARWVIVCTVACAAVLIADGNPDDIALTLTATTLAIGFLMFSFGRIIRANAALRCAQEELADRRVDEERLRFARDLHDLLGHDLSVISLKAQLARRLMDRDPDTARRELADIETVTRTALREVREAVSGYRQPALASELAGARAALDAAGIACNVENPEVTLPPTGEAVLAWGVREATTNVIRHSGAARCDIRIAVGLDEATLEVTDDGCPATNGANGQGDVDGTGLRGLNERAAAAGGRVVAGPRPDGGFGLELRIPLSRAA